MCTPSPDDSPQVTHHGGLDIQVCVPKSWNDETAIAFAELQYPSGTSGGWKVRKEGDPSLNSATERVQCENRRGYVHMMLDA